MLKLVGLFLFTTTIAAAQTQFLRCQGTVDAVPFTLLINADEGNSLILRGHDINTAIQRGSFVYAGEASMQRDSKGCLYGASEDGAAYSLKMPACELLPGSTQATVSAPDLGFEASQVWVQCVVELGDDE